MFYFHKNGPFKKMPYFHWAWPQAGPTYRPERPKGAKDEVKQARGAQSRPEGPLPRSRGPEGP